MKGIEARTELLRVSAYLVKGDESIVDLENGVFETLGHNGPCDLLESHYKL